jgi:hypothetical protein
MLNLHLPKLKAAVKFAWSWQGVPLYAVVKSPFEFVFKWPLLLPVTSPAILIRVPV